MRPAQVPLAFDWPFPLGVTSVAPEHYAEVLHWDLGVILPEALTSAVPKRQALFLLGRWCALQALNPLKAGPWPEIKINEDRSPLWPEGVVGSISHSSTLILASAAWQKDCPGMGLDCESLMSLEQAERLSSYILSPGDTEAQTELLSFADFVSLVFSAKESLFKALYPQVQIFFGFQAAQLTSLTANTWTLQLIEPVGHYPKGASFQGQYSFEKKHVITGIYQKSRP